MNNQTNHIENTLNNKKEITKLILVAALLALGIGILSSALVALSLIPNYYLIILGFIIIFISIILLIKRLFSELTFNFELNPIFFISKKNNVVYPVLGYDFSIELSKILIASFLESKSLLKEWKKNPIIEPEKKSTPKQSAKKTTVKIEYLSITRQNFDDADEIRKSKSSRIICEAVEFIILEQLSLHLSSYFNNYPDNDKYIKTFQRKDIPAFLLENRILSLLTTPIEQRDIFLNAFPDEDQRPKGELYSLYGSDGSIYNRFDLILPKDTTIMKSEEGEIIFENKRLIIRLKVDFLNFSFPVEREFIKFYMKKKPDDIETRKIDIYISGKIKPFSLLASSGWNYHQWLDSFCEQMHRFCLFDFFLENIGWTNLSALLFVHRRNQK